MTEFVSVLYKPCEHPEDSRGHILSIIFSIRVKLWANFCPGNWPVQYHYSIFCDINNFVVITNSCCRWLRRRMILFCEMHQLHDEKLKCVMFLSICNPCKCLTIFFFRAQFTTFFSSIYFHTIFR